MTWNRLQVAGAAGPATATPQPPPRLQSHLPPLLLLPLLLPPHHRHFAKAAPLRLFLAMRGATPATTAPLPCALHRCGGQVRWAVVAQGASGCMPAQRQVWAPGLRAGARHSGEGAARPRNAPAAGCAQLAALLAAAAPSLDAQGGRPCLERWPPQAPPTCAPLGWAH